MKPFLHALLLAVAVTATFAASAHDAGAPPLLIRHGYVMTMDAAQGDLPQADVLIADGRIVAIGKDLGAPHDARQIDATGKVVLPGFVDTHSHLYVTTMRGQFRNAQGKFFPVSSKLAAAMQPTDIRTAMSVGALELLHGGITTTADFFDNIRSPADADAGLDALDASGIRAVMYYGGPDKTTSKPIDVAYLSRLAAQRPDAERVQLGLAWRLPRELDNADNWRMRQQEIDSARRMKLPVQVHVSGQAGPMFDALIQRRYLAPDLSVVHATDATAAQLQALEDAGGALALTPISEQRVAYGLTRVDHFASVSRTGLGIDGNALAGSADMFATLRLAALTWSGGARDEAAPDPRALLTMATLGGARTLGMERDIGSLAPGKRADLQLIDLQALNLSGFGGGDPAALLVYSATPANVSTVIVDGRVLKHEGALVDVDLPALLSEARRSATQLIKRAAAAP